MRCSLVISIALAAKLLGAQAPQTAAEVSTQNEDFTFKSKVTLVLVPVVVRDKSGKTSGELRKEDFQLFDKGKAQEITKFSVEKSSGKAIAHAPEVDRAPDEKDSNPVIAPDHFAAFLFDDIHLNAGDLLVTRAAAEKHLAAQLKPTDRIAIYTTSGQTTLDFTDDREALHKALNRLLPRPIARNQTQGCPDISFYQADQIVNKHDMPSLAAGVAETRICLDMQKEDEATVERIVQSLASQVLQSGEQETRVALSSLRDVVRRMSLMPGQRMVLMISPGFLRLVDNFTDETAVIDQAIRSGVTINALDARGLYTGTPDITQRVISLQSEQTKQQLARQSAFAEGDILGELASGTGGTFVENTNDLTHGFEQLAAAPDVYYVLGFSPQNLKLDGTYHSLKVSIKAQPGLTPKARRGYYAPRHLSSADEDAKEEVTQALFSREEKHDIPIEIRTQFFKSSGSEAKLAVISKVDVKKLRFRKADGRNSNDLLIVSALFDRNGNYVNSVSKTVKMRLLDGTLQSKLGGGISVRSDFKVAPGTYVIRLVVRDSEGQSMAAQNGAVEIP